MENKMNRKDKAQLQRLINASIKANNAVHVAERALNRFCDSKWGFAPSDRDIDTIIDGCMGGCGQSMHFDAEEFVRLMDAEFLK